jgi:vesicle coat complex subunit
MERILPRLAHNNPGVVTSAVKVIMIYMDLITDNDTIRSLSKKIGSSLITLLANKPEITYVALRCINLVM